MISEREREVADQDPMQASTELEQLRSTNHQDFGCTEGDPISPISQPKTSIPVEPSSAKDTVTTPILRRSLRKRHVQAKISAMVTASASTGPVLEPSCYEEAVEYRYWQDAMREEYASLIKHGTWIPQECHVTASQKIIGCKWVYRTKIDADGKKRHKARLVIKGYEQVNGIDYEETFAPVARLSTSAKNYPASDTAPLRPVRPELRPLRPLRPVRPELRPLRPVHPELPGNASSNSMRHEFPRNAGSHPMPPGPRCDLLCVRMGGCLIAAS